MKVRILEKSFDDYVGVKLKEKQVQALSSCLYEFIKSNPEFIKAIIDV